MGFIATYWYVWLVVMLAGYGYALRNQLRRMKKMMKDGPVSVLNSVGEGTFFKGIGKMIVAGTIGTGGAVLLAIAVIVKIIDYAK